jgi:transcriptional regulator with AAA-type ATPase domain
MGFLFSLSFGECEAGALWGAVSGKAGLFEPAN